MNGFLANLARYTAYSACLFLACEARGQAADSGNSYPVHFHAHQAWLPCEGSIGPMLGVQTTRLRATSEYRSLVEPVPSEDGPWVSPAVGAEFSVRWRQGFTLAFTPRRETYGLRTVEDTVSFQGSPYPHTLKASTELAYNVYPLMAGMGWYPGRQHFQVQLGVFRALFDHGKVEWIADGESYSGHPAPFIRESFDGWMAAAEYGFRFGPGEWDLGIEYRRAGESAMDWLKGSLRPEAAQVHLAYAWILWHRPP